MSRQHGTYACYQLGVEGNDYRNGCRCLPCRVARARYDMERSKARERGPALVDASEAREHLLWLQSQGVGYRAVYVQTGVSDRTVRNIREGRQDKARPETVDKILSVGRSNVRPGSRVDAAPTWKLIGDLLDAGHTRAQLARMLGSRSSQAHPGLQIGKEWVTALTAQRVAALHWRLMRPEIVRRENQAAERRWYRKREAS